MRHEPRNHHVGDGLVSTPRPSALRPVRIRIVTSHTGAGHARVAEALAESLRRRHGDRAVVHTVDVMANHAPFPFHHAQALGALWTGVAPATYGWSFRLTNGERRTRLMLNAMWPRCQRDACRLVGGEPVDVLVSTYSMINHFLAWAKRDMNVSAPIVTMVTDPMAAHSVWLSPDVDRVLVGSERVREQALRAGVAHHAVQVTGMPVNPSFVDRLLGRADAHSLLGWDPSLPVVLILGGGDGIGSMEALANRLDSQLNGVRLVVVTARNVRLRQRLNRKVWRNPVHVLGFVDHVTEMSVLMSAVDILVTKAGPGTLHDAFLAGLPIIISGAIPGQEDANVTQVVDGGAGCWAPHPREVLAACRAWLDDDTLRGRVAERSRALACPNASDAAADAIWDLASGGR